MYHHVLWTVCIYIMYYKHVHCVYIYILYILVVYVLYIYIYGWFTSISTFHTWLKRCERILRIQISTDSYRKVDWLYIYIGYFLCFFTDLFKHYSRIFLTIWQCRQCKCWLVWGHCPKVCGTKFTTGIVL